MDKTYIMMDGRLMGQDDSKYGPVHEILVPTALASSENSGQSANIRRLI